MPRKKYLTVKEEHNIDNEYPFSGKLKDIISSLEKLASKYDEDAFINLDAGYNNISVYLTIERKETDEEREKRLVFERKMRERTEARKKKNKEERRKLYEKLKKEFGDV